VTLVLLVCAGGLVLSLRRPRLAIAVVPLCAALWGVGWWSLAQDWTRPDGEPLRVALVQGNVPLEQKWVAAQKPVILEHYRALSARAPEAQLVVWPEAAVPGFADTLPDAFWRQLEERAAGGVTTLFGVLERTGPDTYFNSLIAVTPMGRASYRKAHLVPFGEYLPWKWAFDWLLDYLQIPMSDFSAGSGAQSQIRIGETWLGLSICYEDAFGRELLSRLPKAGLLVNVSEDGWFGKSIGPHQRMDMARLRSMETGRPGLRAATTGISAIIDARGRVQASTRQFEPTVLRASVQPRTGSTPFVALGGYAAEAAALCMLLLGWALRRRRTN
jgi:apolipoprotein N-acyltransferase